METKNRSASLTLWANRALMVIIAVLACSMPRLLRWYNQFRPLEKPTNLALLIAFYLCVPVTLFALYHLEKLLGNKQFTTLLADLVERPQGKPTLVPVSDKRPEMTNAKNDFANE